MFHPTECSSIVDMRPFLLASIDTHQRGWMFRCLAPEDNSCSLVMAAVALLLILWTTWFVSAKGNHYFATHTSYDTSTLDSTVIFAAHFFGDVVSVTQQCRRNCALNPLCKAYSVTKLRNESPLSSFNCRFFELNACNWTTVSLVPTPSAPSNRLWEKLDAAEMKPKPCVEHCAVRFRGNCTACRGYDILKGIDCDITPKLCSGYVPSNWNILPIWPWGFYGRKLNVVCYQGRTSFLALYGLIPGTRILEKLEDYGVRRYENLTNVANFTSLVQQIDWVLTSELVALSDSKELYLELFFNNASTWNRFAGFQLSPYGELSLNASLDNPVSNAFQLPLSKAPFVNPPLGYGSNCGSFWQFKPNVSLCQQETNLMNFGNLKRHGVISTDPSTINMLFI